MPLIKGSKAKTKSGISENIRREIETGKSKKQSIAIALGLARKSNKKSKKI